MLVQTFWCPNQLINNLITHTRHRGACAPKNRPLVEIEEAKKQNPKI